MQDRAEQLAVLDEMREKGFAERRIRIRASIAAGGGVDVAPDTPVRCWLPLPAKCPQVCDIQLRDATSGVRVAPADAPQRTAYWETCGEREFYVD